MSVITITYPAKCKDCKFLKPYKFGGNRRHICTNKESPRYDANVYLSQVRLKDKVCDVWELIQ